jgi:hypothetical protein
MDLPLTDGSQIHQIPQDVVDASFAERDADAERLEVSHTTNRLNQPCTLPTRVPLLKFDVNMSSPQVLTSSRNLQTDKLSSFTVQQSSSFGDLDPYSTFAAVP